MELKGIQDTPLNEQQLLMLRLLKTPMPENDFNEIRRLAVKILAKQIDQSIEGWENKNCITEKSYEDLIGFHFRSRSKTYGFH